LLKAFARLLSAALLLTACEGRPRMPAALPKPSAAARLAAQPITAATPNDDCERSLVALERWQAKLPPGFAVDGQDLRLAEPKASAPHEPTAFPSTTLRLGHEYMHMPRPWLETDFEKLPTLMADALRQDRADKLPLSLVVEIDRDRPWADVTKAADDAASAGFEQLQLALQESFQLAPPPSSLTAESEHILEVEDKVQSLVLLARLLQRVVDPCAPARKLLNDSASVEIAEKKMALFREDMPSALRECRCRVSPSDWANLLWLMQGPDRAGVIHRELIDLTIRLSQPGERATSVKAAASEPWSESLPRVIAAATANPGWPLRFEIADH
jgi:hypothetical protein